MAERTLVFCQICSREQTRAPRYEPFDCELCGTRHEWLEDYHAVLSDSDKDFLRDRAAIEKRLERAEGLLVKLRSWFWLHRPTERQWESASEHFARLITEHLEGT